MGNTASKSPGLCSLRAIARSAKQKYRRWSLPFNNMPGREDLHRYTRCRFVWDEAREMAKRHVSFDVEALANTAADAMGSSHCDSILKLLDSNYSKTLLLTMDDGVQVVAKIPNPNAGRPHLTIASEVATMDFARNLLELPVPKVYAWCSHAESTPVGAEYIIMEKARGVLLETVLPQMSFEKRWALAKAVGEYQLQLAELRFGSYGSLYYRSDLPDNTGHNVELEEFSADDTSRFVVGPTTGRGFNDDGKSSVDLDIGPWKNASDYLKAAGTKEVASIKHIDRPPPSPISIFGPGTYQPTKEKKLRAAESYLDVLPHLIPDDTAPLQPCLGHPALHDENIFVNPEDPTEVTAIIDWQATEILPLCEQALKPPFINHKGPQAIGLSRPCLPSNFKELPEPERLKTQDLFIRQTLVVLWNTLISLRNPEMWRAIEFQGTLEYKIMGMLGIILVEGEATLLRAILEFLDTHPEIFNTADGVHDPARQRLLSLIRDRETIKNDSQDAQVAVQAMTAVREAMGGLFPDHGQVHHDNYDEIKEMLRDMKEQVIDQCAETEQDRIAWQESWPFDD